MKKQRYHYARQRRQFRHLAQQLNQALETGAFQQLAIEKQRTLVRKFKHLYRKVAGTFQTRQLRHLLAGGALLLGLSGGLQAQDFAPAVVNPFGIDISSDPNWPTFADIDNDGDLDLFTISYSPISYSLALGFHENTGTPALAQFESPIFQAFGIMQEEITTAALGDMDNDGDLDLMVGSYNSASAIYMENTGTPESPSFGPPQDSPFGLTSGIGAALVDIADIDTDGDQDVFFTDVNGGFSFFENIGTPELPSFAPVQLNSFGLPPASSASYRFFEFGDIDNDGDLDLIAFEWDYYNSNTFFLAENSGTPENPIFEAPSSVTNINADPDSPSQPAFGDIDSDGDLDIFIGAYGAGLSYYENLLNANMAPTSADFEITVLENTAYTFAESDFPYDDPDSDLFEGVEISALPTAGELFLDGVLVGNGQFISLSEIPLLEYMPEPDAFGMDYATIGFKVSDGISLSDQYTITVQVDENTATFELLGLEQLSVSPNPASDQLQVHLVMQAPLKELQISLLNTLGQELQRQDFELNNREFNTQLDISTLPEGWYVLAFYAEDARQVVRFLKQ